MFVSLSRAWRWAHNFLYYLWQVQVNACITAHVQRGPGEPVTCPLLQFLHSILPRYNYSTLLPTCSSPCRSVRRPPAPRHPHMQIRRLPPPLTPTAPDCLAVSRRGGDLVPPLRPLPPPPRRTRLPPQYAGCARGVRFIQGRRPARPTNLWIFSFPTPDEVFQLPTDSVFVLCLCFTPVEVNAAPEPALPCRHPPSRPLPVVDEMLSGTECLLSSTDTDVSHTCRVLYFTLKVVAYKK